MQNSKTFLLVLLGILAAFGPFVTDMYLPGLPSMTVYFDTTASMVQLGITTAMLGLGFGQINCHFCFPYGFLFFRPSLVFALGVSELLSFFVFSRELQGPVVL